MADPVTLTPEQQKSYYASQTDAAKPLSPAEYLASLPKDTQTPSTTTPPTTTTTPTTPSSDSSSVRRDVTAAGGTGSIPPSSFNVPTYDEFKASIGATSTPPPAQPQLTDVYQQMRQAQGITAIEDTIGQYDSEKADLMSKAAELKLGATEGYSEATAGARISEADRNIQDKIDFINRQEALAQNKLQIKNDFINTMMGYTEKDYNTTRQNYEYEFNKNLQIQNAYTSAINRELTLDEKQKNDARATLSSMWNMAKESVAKDPKTLDDYFKTNSSTIQQLELQAGEPAGSFEAYVRAVPDVTIIGKVKGTDANGKEFMSYQGMDANGQIINTKVYTGGVATKTVASASQNIQVKASQYSKIEAAGVPSNIAKEITNQYQQGKTPDEIKKMLTDAGLDPTLLDKYNNIINPPKKGSTTRFGATQ